MLNDPTSPLRPLAVCVDDFGLHEGVNQAVFELLALRRISAVSCLVDGPAWASGAQALRDAVKPQGEVAAMAMADVGLHLNFTETLDVAAQSACPSQPLGALIQACCLRRLSVARLRAEIERQWARFEAVWGAPPDFIDGHQHVHQLPQIREALQQVLQAKLAQGGAAPRPWVRQCRSPGWRGWRAGIAASDTVKAAVIATLGSARLGRIARGLGLAHSQHLLGVYPFDADATAYVQRWRTWLALVQAPQRGQAGDLLMCHPSTPLTEPPPWPDVIAASRQMEHAVLTSEAFATLLQDAGVRVTRLGR